MTESRVEFAAVPRVMFPEPRTTVTALLTIQLSGVPPPDPLCPMLPLLVINWMLDPFVNMKLFAEFAPLLRLSNTAPGLMIKFPPILRFKIVLGVLLPLQVTKPPSITTSPPTERSLTAELDKKRAELAATLEPCMRNSCR